MDRIFLHHNGGQVITVEGNVQIGRGRGEHPRPWYSERPRPPDLGDLGLFIDIDGSPSMSRNHAGIRREGEAYTVQDLNSLNGTYRNDVRIIAGTHHVLAVGDRIGMGDDQFLVSDTPSALEASARPELRDALFEFRAEWYLGVAGAVEDEHTRHAFYCSVARVANELYRRGYRTAVHAIRASPVPRLYGHLVEVIQLATILASLNRRACAVGATSHTVFQFSGHGTKEGLVLNAGELLTPHLLFDVVGSIRGKKLVILDACHAGVFLEDRKRIPPQTVVLAATRDEEAPAFADGEGATATYADLPMTMLSRRLWELLRERKVGFNLQDQRSALEAAFQHEDDGMVYVQVPGMNTAPYTVCLKSVTVCLDSADLQRLIVAQRGARTMR